MSKLTTSLLFCERCIKFDRQANCRAAPKKPELAHALRACFDNPVRGLRIFLFVCSAVSVSLGQGSIETTANAAIADADRDHPELRAAWFLRGRIAPEGESAALLRYRAYQQKLQLRRQQLAASAISPVPHASSTAMWAPLGPAPLASDATGNGGQDYHQVSGRATAVAVDDADSTGNTVYIGGAHGGVWKSTNAGPLSANATSVVWTPVLDYESTLAVGAIAIQPGNTDATKSVVLVGTGEPNSSADSYYGLGILRSADAGQTWSLIGTADGGAHSFAGMGFSKIAFNSTTGKTNVVVAAAAAAETGITLGLDTTGANRGLYYSTDSGATWSYATVQDPGGKVSPGSATSVVYNNTAGAFFAALRYHGIYTSTDGINWSRLANQPAGLTAALCPSATPTSPACPIYRAEMTVVPGRNEMYTWVVYLSSGVETDGGIWQSLNGGTSWTQVSDSGITTCGDGTGSGCGVEQGTYNLEIAAVPNGTASTDLYAGTINLYKCTIANPASPSSCSFMNLTHAYGCTPASALAHVHPDQHALDFIVAGSPAKAVMYFANDGGVYRALDGYTGLTTGSCSGTNLFDSLNVTLGSMTQFVSFSVHPTDPKTLLGGTQDNGSPATASAGTSTSWLNVLGGDGGYNAISPATSTDWFAANPDVPPGNLNVNYCGSGINCNNVLFTPVVRSSQVGGDDGSFYFPYMLDPLAPTRLIIGTCRVWRGGPATSSAGTYTTLSNNFDGGGSAACTGGEVNLVRSLAAGGPTIANGSKVVYAGTEGLGGLGTSTPPGGRVFVTTNAEVTVMADMTGSINPGEYPVSGIGLDSSDASGQTAYVTIMGFNVSHVFKTTNAGTNWTDFTSNLPNAPADAVVVDGAAGQVYVGTDVGVFVSSSASASWTEVGPLSSAAATGYLPNVPVTALRIFNSGGQKLLRASTYGRGIWEYDLTPPPDYQITISNPTVTVFPNQTATFNGALIALNGYTGAVSLTCGAGAPTTCTPPSAAVTPAPNPGTAFTLTAAGAVGDYSFNVHGVGTDPSATTHDAPVTLHVVDFGLTAPSPASVSVQQGNTSPAVTFQVTAAGSFSGTVTLSCPGLGAGLICNFSPAASVSSFPTAVQLTITTTSTTPTGTTTATISAMTTGAPAAKTQTLSITVTAPVADYSLAVSNSPVTANVNQSGTFNGTLTALNGYSSPVNLGCGAGAPPTCMVAPASVTPTVAGVQFTVTVSSSVGQSYSFSINATGTDAAHVTHATTIVFNSFTFTLTNGSGTQTVKAGQTATYNLAVTPVGSTTFPNAVSFTCSGLPAGSTCSNPQISAGANGAQTVSLSVTTVGTGGIQIRPVAKREDYTPFLLWVSGIGMVAGGLARKPSTRKRSTLMISLVLAMLSTIILPACGGGGASSGGGGSGSSGTVQVSVSPSTAQVALGQQMQFTASVTGTSNVQVTWQVNGVTGGSAGPGTIASNGLYTAPSAVPNPPTATISAVSQADVTKSGSATVTIVSPTASGTYTITVTAIEGGLSQNTTATLVVQ